MPPVNGTHWVKIDYLFRHLLKIPTHNFKMLTYQARPFSWGHKKQSLNTTLLQHGCNVVFIVGAPHVPDLQLRVHYLQYLRLEGKHAAIPSLLTPGQRRRLCKFTWQPHSPQRPTSGEHYA